MSDLTALTLAAARDGLRAKRFSAVELGEAAIAAVAAARPLNCFITETPDHARRAARDDAERLARGEARRPT